MIVAFVLLLLSGCIEQQLNEDNLGESKIAIEIPSEIVQHFGSLNIEQKVEDVKKTIHSDGLITITLKEAQFNQISQVTEEQLRQYLEMTTAKESNGIHNIEMNKDYSEWAIIVANKSIIGTEGFELAEELLIKNALTYQLVNRQLPEVKIRYFTDSNKLLNEKVIETNFAYSDE